MMKILIADDEKSLREILREFLENEGFRVEEAEDGREAYEKIIKASFDLVILDVMMPGIGGLELCAKIKRITGVPVIMFTAKDQEDDFIKGFHAGADDYLVKPFSNKVLVEKVKAMLRRNGKKEKRYDIGELKIDIESMRAYFRGEDLNLTATEFDILSFFVENSNLALSRDRILHKVWGLNYSGDPRTIDTHIKNLRKKMEDMYIETVRGVGYRFEVKR